MACCQRRVVGRFELLCPIPSGVGDSTVAVVVQCLVDVRYVSCTETSKDMEVGQQTALCQDRCHQMYSLQNLCCQPFMSEYFVEGRFDAVESSILVGSPAFLET